MPLDIHVTEISWMLLKADRVSSILLLAWFAKCVSNSSNVVTLVFRLVCIAFNLILMILMGIRDYPFPSKEVLIKLSSLADSSAFLSFSLFN